MHNFSPEQGVEPFEFGDQPAPGVLAHEIGAICPDETALEIPAARAVALADGLVGTGSPGAPLGFVPDHLLGDRPEQIKADLQSSYRRLLECEFDTVLLAHGAPLVGDGRERLEQFVG
jgi:hypothetical protein